jgi:hypothetical protein
MNYFERLLRRALLRPASAPGAALDDPFTAVAEWKLDMPMAKPEGEAAAPVAAVERVIETERRALPPGEERPVAASPAAQTPADVLQPPSALLGDASPQMAQSTLETIPTQPAGDGVAPATLIAPQREALALADAFMRSIGVQSQLRDLAPEPARHPEAARPSAAAMPEEESARVPRSSPVVPAPPPPPAPAPRSDSLSGAKAPASSPKSRRETRAETAPRTRTVVETRQVVVERKASPRREDSGVTGGGSPRFGLGQL